MRGLKAFVVLLLAGHLWLGGPSDAQAYPQWQFTSGTSRCSQCHVSPAGGGLLTSYGRDAAATELSTVRLESAYSYLERLPSWLSLGAELRGGAVAHDVDEPTGTQVAAFPMQADLLGRVTFREFSAYGTLGMRGQVRAGSDTVPDQNYQPISTSRLITREHWLMWQRARLGPYLRAGRFFAPFGLRLAEHVTYVRRDLGFNQLEESYNISGGYLADQWELHITGFGPDVLRHIGSRDAGLAAYYEHRVLNDSGLLGLQAKWATHDGIDRLIAGFVGKQSLPTRLPIMFLLEANLVQLQINTGSRAQFIGAAGVAFIPVRGALITALVERNHVDIDIKDAAWSATTLLLGWFPYPHVELQVMGRVQFPSGMPATETLFGQLHFYF